MDRAETIDRIRQRRDPWDVIVIGGGATGVGCALDAASRGFDVLLLEQHDFGKGTSSRSTKLVHGGVRYLRQGNISLVREALRERGRLLKNAPHVVHKRAFVIPCYSVWQKIFYGVGLKIYDLLAGKYAIGRSRMLSRGEVTERLQNIETDRLRGGVLYYDGQFDDTRLLIDLALTAQKYGAATLNYARVTGLRSNDEGKIIGVEFEDVEKGELFHAGAKSVINASGVFCDSVRKLSDAEAQPVITYSQGIHAVFDKKFLPGETALMIPKTSDGRVLFCIPWHDHLLVGTTDTPLDRPTLEPEALAAEIDFVIETAGEYLTSKPTHRDILSVFAGIRPLVRSGVAAKTSSLSRGHDLFVDKSGLITITGGKWTTYRRMAEDAVNTVIEIAELPPRQCVTADLSITSAEDPENGEDQDSKIQVSRDEVVRAVGKEMARTVEDVLARRTRVLFLDARAAVEIAPQVAEIMAGELGKDIIWVEDQVREFKETARAYSLK
ncbi:glycerol-3-phosphate dehydrogenase/oxidase [soil metagenome]